MRAVNGFGELYCTRGEHWGAPEEFARDSRAKSGRSSWCRKCTAEYRRQRRTQQKTDELRQLAERKKLQPIY